MSSIFSRIYSQNPFCFANSRAVGMGSAFTAVPGDVNSIFFNPAGLAYVEREEIMLSSSIQSYSVTNLASMMKSNFYQSLWNVAFAKNNFGIASGVWRREQLKGITKLVIDKKGIYYEWIINVSYGFKVSKNLFGGITAKYLTATSRNNWVQVMFLSEPTHSFSMDLGFLWDISDKITLGVIMQDLVSKNFNYILFDYIGQPMSVQNLPSNLNIGTRYYPVSNLMLVFDIRSVIEKKHEKFAGNYYKFKRAFHMGCEYLLYPYLALRIGLIRLEHPQNFYSNLEWDIENDSAHGVFLMDYDTNYIFTFGVGFESSTLGADFAMKVDDRKKDLKEIQTNGIDFTVEGQTFQYFMSLSWYF